MKLLRRLVSLALFVGLWVGGWQFAARNPDPVAIDYLAGELPMQPVWLLLFAAFAVGVLAAGVLATLIVSRAKLATRRARRHAAKLEAELHQLRNLPLASQEDAPPRGSAGGAPDLRAAVGSLGKGA